MHLRTQHTGSVVAIIIVSSLAPTGCGDDSGPSFPPGLDAGADAGGIGETHSQSSTSDPSNETLLTQTSETLSHDGVSTADPSSHGSSMDSTTGVTSTESTSEVATSDPDTTVAVSTAPSSDSTGTNDESSTSSEASPTNVVSETSNPSFPPVDTMATDAGALDGGEPIVDTTGSDGGIADTDGDAGAVDEDAGYADGGPPDAQTTEPVPLTYTILFTTIGATSNGYGQAGNYGSIAYANAPLYFIGITPVGSGYFEVYDTGGEPAAGVSGSNPYDQERFAMTTFSTPFTARSFNVYNAGEAAVDVMVGGWSGSFSWGDSVPDLVNSDFAVAPGWSTVTLEGFDGIVSLTVDWVAGTPLYFNAFVVE